MRDRGRRDAGTEIQRTTGLRDGTRAERRGITRLQRTGGQIRTTGVSVGTIQLQRAVGRTRDR